MFAFIKGKIEYKYSNMIVVEAGGIGYKINTSSSTLENCGETGTELKVFTYLYVRENIVELIGFLSMEELSMFELLITVSGVGAKAALSICGILSPSRFSLAVITDDATAISRAPGIGAKTAQKIILELKDKMKKSQIAGGPVNEGFEGGNAYKNADAHSKFDEAVSALMVLGYSTNESNRAVSIVYREDDGIEDIIKKALKGLIKS